jgi:hypothetical protein
MKHRNPDNQQRFDAFKHALNDLCRLHGIQLCTSEYDGLEAWALLAGDPPVYCAGFENRIHDDSECVGRGPAVRNA